MAAYIKAYADALAKSIESCISAGLHDIVSRLVVLREELDRLDPRDFEPDSRLRFIDLRRRARQLASVGQDAWDHEVIRLREIESLYLAPTGKASDAEQFAERGRILVMHRERRELCEAISAVLGGYPGVGTARPVRSFWFVVNIDIREIVERDYRELAVVLMPEGAWKSAVVMAGSILEAILYDQLTKDQAAIAAAMGHAPNRRGGGKKDITKDDYQDEWTLKELIDVAASLQVIPMHRADSIDQVLRDYRNFVHPKKELKRKHPCREAEALQAKGSLDAVSDHLDPNVT